MSFQWPDVGDRLRLMPTLAVLGFIIWVALRPRKPRKRQPVRDGPADERYRVFTRSYDLEVTARDVPFALAVNSLDPDRRWSVREPDVWRDKIGAMRALLADLEVRAGSSSVLRERFGFDFRPQDWVICLLIDQSGSMRDEPILNVAASVRWVSDRLREIGVATGVLGFSTVGWKGGKPRRDWLVQGRPKRPGRLCALLHILYQPIGGDLTDEDWEVMIHPDILCENIDGEAIEWAVRLLAVRPEKHRLLIMISDGAPVDDSTLMENGLSYLSRHIKKVIAETENRRDLILGAVGINYRVDEFYRLSRVAEHLDEVPTAICSVIVEAVSREMESK